VADCDRSDGDNHLRLLSDGHVADPGQDAEEEETPMVVGSQKVGSEEVAAGLVTVIVLMLCLDLLVVALVVIG
jgi:hypothetical protein